MPFLFWRDAQGEKHETEVGEFMTLGRSPDKHVRFDGQMLQVPDPHISRQHARVERTFRGLELVDLGSSNGTRVNAAPLSGYHVLSDGDVIGLGGTIFTFRNHRLQGVEIVSDMDAADVARHVQRVEDVAFPPSKDIACEETLRREYDRLRVSHQLHRAVSNDVDPKVVLERIADAALSNFKPDRVVILLHNPRNGEYEPEVVRHSDPKRSSEVVTISRTILREVVTARTAFISNDARLDQRIAGAESIRMQDVRTTMTAPMLIEGEVRGVLHLDIAGVSLNFGLSELALFQDFAQHAAKALQLAELAEARGQQSAAQERLLRLLPEEIVADVLEGKRAMERGGSMRDATVLFCDIRGFTSLSERLKPNEVVDILNEYFELMVEQIFAFEGALDKFIGDEIMAVWGAHVPIQDHAYKAVCAAIEMQSSIAQLNALRRTRGLEEVAAGIGVNCGELLAGYMGSHRAMNYTVIGDTVNVAARLCSAAAPNEILVSGVVAKAIEGRLPLEQLPTRALKGKSETVELYRVLRQG